MYLVHRTVAVVSNPQDGDNSEGSSPWIAWVAVLGVLTISSFLLNFALCCRLARKQKRRSKIENDEYHRRAKTERSRIVRKECSRATQTRVSENDRPRELAPPRPVSQVPTPNIYDGVPIMSRPRPVARREEFPRDRSRSIPQIPRIGSLPIAAPREPQFTAQAIGRLNVEGIPEALQEPRRVLQRAGRLRASMVEEAESPPAYEARLGDELCIDTEDDCSGSDHALPAYETHPYVETIIDDINAISWHSSN